MALNDEQRIRILEAFLSMDPRAQTDIAALPAEWYAFRYDGRVTLDGLCRLAALITVMLLDETPAC